MRLPRFSRTALLYSPRLESQFTMRCFDESFEEFNVACKFDARNRLQGSSHRSDSGHAPWNGDHGERAVAAGEAVYSRAALTPRAHREVARQPRHHKCR